MAPSAEMLEFLREMRELKAQNVQLLKNQDVIANALLEIARQLERFNKAVRTGTAVGSTLDGFEKLTDGVSRLFHGEPARRGRDDDDDEGDYRPRRRRG